MKATVLLLVGILLGTGIGWYFGYLRPDAKRERELLRQYDAAKDALRMSDQEMADAGVKIPEFMEGMKRTDEMAAAVALGVFGMLQRGETEAAKKRLLMPIGSYYRLYRNRGGNTNLIAQIETAAEEHPSIAAEISRNAE